MSEDLVEIAKYSSLGEAQLAQSWLEASGIQSMLNSDDCGGMHPHFQASRGVRLVVAPEDAESARELLKGDVEDSK